MTEWIDSILYITDNIYLNRRVAKKTRLKGGLKNKAGSDLLFHAVAHIVPSAMKGLTSVFGMGTGVAPSLLPPAILYKFL